MFIWLLNDNLKTKRISGSSEGPCLGIINFSLKYNPEMGLLTIYLIQARNLQPRDFSGTADPYCKVAVVPHVSKMVQSRVQRKTITPEFKESFVFEVPEPDIHRQTINIQLYDYDQFSRDECIGLAMLPLANVDLTEKVEVWKEIKALDVDTKVGATIPDFGDLMFSIAYLPSAERLTIVIMKARNVKHVSTSADGKKSSNTYVKVSLYFMSKRLKKKKTSTKHGTSSPVFNEALVFNVPQHFLKHLKLDIQVTHENKLGQNEVNTYP
ncbi:putative synaptotagmin-5-like [Apostichopus japonicus]|uniref:Putative synaptotagmin-5-like n=1 Tax=Stichopus japonicus TaxID=307972 RepID=A0A2G8LKP4_STIJA|nr:putative synaptotagmin-5-like [Apostichopus japonicus]